MQNDDGSSQEVDIEHHIGSSRFAFTNDGVFDKSGTPLHRLIKTIKGKADPHFAQFLIMEAFDDRYNIQDIPLDENTNPLALVSYTKSESNDRDMFNIRLDQYISHRIKDTIDLSFLEFINLPTYRIDEILERCKKEVIRQTEEAKALSESLKIKRQSTPSWKNRVRGKK